MASRGGAVAARQVEYRLPLSTTTSAIQERQQDRHRRQAERDPEAGRRSTPARKMPAIRSR